MKKNKISVIYGENGIGKSLYYQQILTNKNKEYIPFNYDLAKWYDSKSKTFSEFNLKGKEIREEIFNLNNSLFTDLCNETGIKINRKLLDKIIEQINNSNSINIQKYDKPIKDIEKIFNYVNIWKQEKQNIKNDFIFNNDEINSYLKICSDFKIYKKFLSKWFNLDVHIFHNICVYINLLKYKELDFLKENKYNNNILNIKNELKKFLDNSLEKNSILKNAEKEKIKELLNEVDLDILNTIYRTDYTGNVEDIINTFIFCKIVESNSFKRLVNKIQEYENIKKICTRFNKEKINFNDSCFHDSFKNKFIKNKNNIKISKDFLTIENINLDIEKFSDGEKIIFIFTLFLPIFLSEDKIILFDDVFEKLDIFNTSQLIRNIYSELLKGNNKKIEILTHDINLVKMFTSIFEEEYFNNKKFSLYYPNLIINQKTKKVIITNLKNTTPVLSFEILLKIFKDSFNKKNITTQTYNDNFFIFNFCKYFYRSDISNNWIQIQLIGNNTKLLDSLSIQIYKFISENIFHYSPNIKVSAELKKYFFEFDFNSNFFIGNNKNIDTIDFYNYFIKQFNDKLKFNKYNLNFSKLIDDIKNMSTFIEMEKNFYIDNKKEYGNRKSAFEFYQTFWSENEEEKKKRNNLFHSFTKSLCKYRAKK